MSEVQDLVEVGIAVRAKAGQADSGDIAVVEAFPQGMLVAAIDGLGHGPEALQAADVAASVLKETPEGSLASLIQRCHQQLTRTRGVVMSLASLHLVERRVSWAGVGNVEGKLFRAGEAPRTLLVPGGIIGYELPSVRVSTIELLADDLLVFATDGIHSYFDPAPYFRSSAQAVAEFLLTEFEKRNDDSLVVVTRFLGMG